MRIWRISNYADLSGRGGLLADGRWHRRGTPVVYCADHPATAMLERLVHLDTDEVPVSYRLLAVEVTNPITTLRLTASELPEGWRTDQNATRAIGTDLLARSEYLLVFVPSVLIPHAWNVLLNPKHNEGRHCRVAEVFDELFDSRLAL